jgi:uncharacterized protein
MRFTSTLLIFFLLSFGAAAQTSLTIPQIQGVGTSSTYVSQQVKTAGIVTAKFIGTGKIGGFFLQDPIGDNNPLTSDGLFVSTSTDNVAVGDNVQITGTVTEYSGRTQLGSITNTSILSSNNLLPVVKVQYNAASWNWEQYEGMLLQFDQTLFVTNNSNLKYSGQLTLNPTRIYTPTNQYVHGTAEYNALVLQNASAQITMDDGITTTNYTPIQLADANGTRRTGERIDRLQAVVDNTASGYFIYPAVPPVFYGNPRPAAPTGLGNYNLKVCATNLNYYLPTNYGQGYGPANATQAAQQQVKIVAGLLAIDADLYGIIELEEGQAALTNLVNAMNAATVAGRYTFVNDGGVIDGTFIKVGYLYRADKVTPYLNLLNTNYPSPYYRKKVQAFTLNSNNERFIFSLNHFKAKSSCPTSGTDTDQGDGQGCWNATRVLESTAITTLIANNKAYYGDEDVLIMGDLNAYGKEDPIVKLIQNGYIDMHRVFHADSAYSYVFNGTAGYLDNVLASPTMKSQITGVSVFHVNTDEPTMFEYSGSAYQPNMYCYSDHDPVVVGLSLGIYNKVDNLTMSGKFNITPTLVTDHFMVNDCNGTTIQLYSLNGVLLKQEKITSDAYTVQLNALHLSSGVYFVRAMGEGTVRKLIVMER